MSAKTQSAAGAPMAADPIAPPPRLDPFGSPWRATLILILASAALRFAFAAATGLGIDETYTVATSRHVELSYFDHPPLAWWLARGAATLLGSESAWAVRTPFILLFALSTWLMYRLGALLFGERAGFLAALLMNCAPVLGVTTAAWVLPDGPLDAALLAGALFVARALLVPGASPGAWLLAGCFGGLAMLSKYHGVFLFAGTGLFLLTSPTHRRWLATPWPYLGAAIALAIFSPVIVWNSEHQWISLTFQGARATSARFQPWLPFLVVAGQALFLAPWVWAPLAASAWRAARAYIADPRSWLAFCLGIGPVAFFTLVSAWSSSRPLFHWAMPGYLMFFPLLGKDVAARLDRGSRRTFHWLVASVAFTLIAMALFIIFALTPSIMSGLRAIFPAMADPLAEAAEWTDAADYLRDHGLDSSPRVFVVARRWYEAAKIDYALHGKLIVACIGDDCRGYDPIQPQRGHEGDDAIVMIPENVANLALPPIRAEFATLQQLPPVDIHYRGRGIVRLAVYRATDYRGPPK